MPLFQVSCKPLRFWVKFCRFSLICYVNATLTQHVRMYTYIFHIDLRTNIDVHELLLFRDLTYEELLTIKIK